jgi:hypothetical protein
MASTIRVLGQCLLYAAVILVWILVGFCMDYYLNYRGTRLIATALLFFFGAINAMIGARYLSFYTQASKDLILLRHKGDGFLRGFNRAQHGHRGRRLASATIMRIRIVAMEFGM